ncbi:MAG: HIT family protein [Betaproteobacteria bacterium]|nr:HIT family protein [Betaproteobacteria bacterium]
MGCELCERDGGPVLWRDGQCRIVRVSSDDYPGFLRVILNRHVREMTDLAAPERDRVMRAVFAAESALRALFRPDKVNLASLGNQVPHLHWHVLARFADDRHFPDPIWAPPRRAAQPPRAPVTEAALAGRLAELLD